MRTCQGSGCGFALVDRPSGWRSTVSARKQRRVTLGKLSTLDPEAARKAAKQVLAKADLGQDHQADRHARQAKAAVTFKSIADQYLAHAAKAHKAKTHSERTRYLTPRLEALSRSTCP